MSEIEKIKEQIRREYIDSPPFRTFSEARKKRIFLLEQKLEELNSKQDMDTKYTSISKKPNQMKVSEIQTDTKRFQNRKTAFSQESVDKIVSNFDANKLDAIVVWQDLKDKKYYVISGHSRLKAHQILKKQNIPVRIFEGTEYQAMEYGRVVGNRSGKKETLIEDISAFKFQRDGLGKSKKDLREDWGKEYEKLEFCSYLNENGKFLENLSSSAGKSFPYLEQRAVWVGQLRREYPQLTNAHENELFDYLYLDKKRPKEDGIIKEIFFQKVTLAATRLDFDPNRKLNLSKLEKTGINARKDTADAVKMMNDLDEQIKENRFLYKTAKTQGEKNALMVEIQRDFEEKERIAKNIKLVVKTQNDLFAESNPTPQIPKTPNMSEIKKIVEEAKKRNLPAKTEEKPYRNLNSQGLRRKGNGQIKNESNLKLAQERAKAFKIKYLLNI